MPLVYPEKFYELNLLEKTEPGSPLYLSRSNALIDLRGIFETDLGDDVNAWLALIRQHPDRIRARFSQAQAMRADPHRHRQTAPPGSPAPEFEIGQWVEVIPSERCRTKRSGRIRHIAWHFKDGVYNYYIVSHQKNISKRYLAIDLMAL